MNFSVIGGDLRLSNLAKMLSKDDNKVCVFGLEKVDELNEDKRIKKCSNIDEAIKESDIIISSIPFLKSNGEIYTLFSDIHIFPKDFIKENSSEKIFIAGSIKEKEKTLLEKNYKEVIDLMKQEELTILNTIATAEGAVSVAIQNTDTNLHSSKVLILGFGRVAKIVANRFDKLCSKVTCAARKSTDFAWIQAYGYEFTNINELGENLNKYDIIINTVPQMILDKSRLNFMKKDVLLIDLASVPGGIDFEEADKMHIKYVWALGLPGKIAPVASAEFIKEQIYKICSKVY